MQGAALALPGSVWKCWGFMVYEGRNMTVLKMTGFQGEIPRLIARLLPDSAAQSAVNVRLESGGLTPYRKPKFTIRETAVAAGSVKTIYRNLDGTWLAWSSDVKAVPGPVAQDRLYIFGNGAPQMLVSGTTYPLAMTTPTAALTATVSGTGSGDVYSRLYVYTEVTSFGEESAPCPISAAVNWQAGQSVTLSGFRAPPAGRAIATQRIYRSQTTLSGTFLFFIAERTADTTNYVDTVPVTSQGEPLPSLDWTPPPDTLVGLISLPNGMMAAFKGKELWFCEPYRPHAWPQKYVLTMDYNIVALGAYGTTIVVATDGQPYIVNGQIPDAMAQEKLELNLPCINARGLVDLGYAVAYPSNDGLVVASSSGARVVTDNLMTRNDWLRTSPATFVSGQYYGQYIASYSYVDPSNNLIEGSFIIDLTGQEATLKRTAYRADACWYDIKGGSLFMCFGQDIYEWDAIGQPNEILTWRSKTFILPKPTNLGVMLAEGTTTTTPEEQAAIDAQRQAILNANATLFANKSLGGELNGAAINTYAIDHDVLTRVRQSRYVSIAVYADGKLVYTGSTLNGLMRLPSGFKAQQWEIEISANADISQVLLANTASELENV
jgi:hypothetical protein